MGEGGEKKWVIILGFGSFCVKRIGDLITTTDLI